MLIFPVWGQGAQGLFDQAWLLVEPSHTGAWPHYQLICPLDSYFKNVILKILQLDIMSTSCETDLRSLSLNDRLTVVQIMAWCFQAPSHYPNQCWPSSLMTYGITRPQWVDNKLLPHFITKAKYTDHSENNLTCEGSVKDHLVHIQIIWIVSTVSELIQAITWTTWNAIVFNHVWRKSAIFQQLTHWGWMMHRCIVKQNHHWFRW